MKYRGYNIKVIENIGSSILMWYTVFLLFYGITQVSNSDLCHFW